MLSVLMALILLMSAVSGVSSYAEPYKPPEVLLVANPECTAESDMPTYRLGVSDVLSIRVFGEDDLSGEYRINHFGMVMMPLIGEVYLYGCTVKQAQGLITAMYEDGYLIEPSVVIEISEHRPFYIMGEVRAPGSYEFMPKMTVLKAVARAGGFTYRAQEDNFLIYRQNVEHEKGIKVRADYPVSPGDVIIVKERFF
jgi:polysaccharide export outer membrane protein